VEDLFLQYLLQSCSRGGRGIVEDYDYELFIHGNVGIRRKTQRRIHADARRGHVLLGVDSCVFFRVTPGTVTIFLKSAPLFQAF